MAIWAHKLSSAVLLLCTRFVFFKNQCIHHIFPLYSIYVHYIFPFTISSLHLHCMFIISSLYLHYMFIICPLYLHYIFTISSLYLRYMFIIYQGRRRWSRWSGHGRTRIRHILIKLNSLLLKNNKSCCLKCLKLNSQISF